jgi:hypothetical protein
MKDSEVEKLLSWAIDELNLVGDLAKDTGYDSVVTLVHKLTKNPGWLVLSTPEVAFWKGRDYLKIYSADMALTPYREKFEDLKFAFDALLIEESDEP